MSYFCSRLAKWMQWLIIQNGRETLAEVQAAGRLDVLFISHPFSFFLNPLHPRCEFILLQMT